jgi:hypothetical protein
MKNIFWNLLPRSKLFLWPNGEGVALRRRRLRVRVPPGTDLFILAMCTEMQKRSFFRAIFFIERNQASIHNSKMTERETQAEKAIPQSKPSEVKVKNGINLIREDHQRFKELVDTLRHTTDLPEKANLVQNLAREVSQTCSASERYLYPLILRHLKGNESEMLYQRVYMDGKINKELLRFLERYGPPSLRPGEIVDEENYSEEQLKIFDSTLEKFFVVLLDHIEKFENWVLFRLDTVLDSHIKNKLYEDLIWGKRHGPTHAHPEGSSTSSSISKILHPVVGVADRIRDTFSS